MKKIYTILILLFCFTAGYSQHDLTGVVLNQDDMKPLAGVSAFIPELKKQAVTDSNGVYKFNDLPSSQLRIRFALIGYKQVIRTVHPGQQQSVDIALEVSHTELNEVLIVTDNNRDVSEFPAPVSTYSQEELRSHSHPTLMGNLAYEPGIDRISIGNGIGKPVIRGLSFNQVLLYSQGTRIENQTWDDHHDLGLSDVGMQNVEVVRGPAALLYGSDALGGAMIFTDEKSAPAGKIIGDANFALHTNTMGGNGDAGFQGTEKDGVFYGLRAGGTLHTSYLMGENGKAEGALEEFAPNSKFKSYFVKANAGVSKKWGVSKFSYSVHQQAIGIIEDESGSTKPKEEEANEQREYEVEAPYQDVNTQITSLENTIYTGKSKLKINVAYQRNDRKEYEPRITRGKDLAIGLDLRVSTFDVRWSSNEEKPLGITIGTQGTFLENSNYGMISLVPDATSKTYAGFGLIRYDWKKFRFMAGLRTDHQELKTTPYTTEGIPITIISQESGDTIYAPYKEINTEFDPFNFSVGTTFNASEKLALKVNFATGFTAPNYHQLAAFGKHEGTFRFEVGDSQLDMVQNFESDFGITFQSSQFTFGIDAYLNQLKNYIYIENTGDTVQRIKPGDTTLLPVYAYRQNDAMITGFELSADFHPAVLDWLDLKASYAYIRGELDKGGNLPYIPSNKLTGEVRLSKKKIGRLHNDFISIHVSNYQKQENVTEYEMSTDGYTLIDLRIGCGFYLGKQMAEVSLFCTNVFDQAYYNQLSLVKEIGIRDMGRNIGVQLRLPFGLRN